MLTKVLKTCINEINTISGDTETLQHPLYDVHSFNDIKEIMSILEAEFPQFTNLRFVSNARYIKTEGYRYGVTREWYDLVGDYRSELLENLE